MLFKNIHFLSYGKISPIPSLCIYQKIIARIFFPTNC